MEPSQDNAAGTQPEKHPLTIILDNWLPRLALWLGGLAIIIMMMLTIIDVFMRYVFDSPIHGGTDMSAMVLVVVVAFSIGYSARSGGQVVVELFTNIWPEKLNRIIGSCVHVIGIFMLIILVWRLFESGLSASEYGETTTTIHIPFEPFYYILAIGMAIYAIVLLVELIAMIMRGDSPINRDI
jgi:TRAP-type transport system small permease protein